MDGRPPCETSEEQMIATFNHGREEMRFLKKHEWLITNYAVIAFAALAITPTLVDKGKWHWLWLDFVSVFAFVLVVLAGLQAVRVLWYTEAQRNMEHRRLLKGIERLNWMGEIEQIRPLKRSERPPWVRLLTRDRNEASQGTDSGVDVKPGLALVVILGASFANVIILSRMATCLALAVVFGFVLVWAVGEFILSRTGQRFVSKIIRSRLGRWFTSASPVRLREIILSRWG
jgi:hypothetical protein